MQSKGIWGSLLVLTVVLSGCASSTKLVGSLLLPTSQHKIDVVQHRSSTWDGCAELVVLQTYSEVGALLDSQAGRGRTLPCTVVEVGIEAGSRVGSAAIIGNAMVKAAKATKPDVTNIDNQNTQSQGQSANAVAKQSQGQGQVQGQQQEQLQSQGQASINVNANNAQGGQGGQGGAGEHGNHHGNNGGGNGGGDGSPNGHSDEDR